MTGERWYLDVAAVRIQQWLARTPDLKGWRGASAALSIATGRSAWAGRTPEGMVWNDDAGDVDGVVSLCSVDGLDEAQARAAASAAETNVVARLRVQLPAVAFEVAGGWASSYAVAYEMAAQRRAEGQLARQYPPAPAQVMLAKPCGACRTDPARHKGERVADEGPDPDLCDDCRARYRAAGATTSSRTYAAPRAERRLGQVLAERGPNVTFPDDFAELAEAGRQAGDDTPTQIALIYADGNRVGQFLHKAAEHHARTGRPAKAHIVTAIDRACVGALAEAVATVFNGRERMPVLAHVGGGDDVLVSVPAPSAWPIVRHLLNAFSTQLAETTNDWPPQLCDVLPTMSAGLVFHHRSAPFPDMVRQAHARLKAAKRATRGDRPAVAFLDTTADGSKPPRSRNAVSVDDLSRRAPQLADVAALPAAHRAMLLSLLHLADPNPDELGDADPAAVAAAKATAAATLGRRVLDLGETVLWRIALDAGDSGTVPGDKVSCALREDKDARARVRTAVDLARWWPPTRETREAP